MKRVVVFWVTLCLIMVVVVAHAAEVKNLAVKQVGSRMLCEYNLTGDEGVAEVNVTITVKGQAYSSDKLHIEGDFGKVKPGNGKKIWWNVLQDFPRGLSDVVEWDVAAEEAQQKKPMPVVRTSISSGNEISRDGRFIAYNNGTVLDTKTNLMWAARDNGKNINWVNAKSYSENYRGGGYSDWRMPSQDELAGLYDKGIGYTPVCAASGDNDKVKLTNLITLSCWSGWASDMSGYGATAGVANFGFAFGGRSWDSRFDDDGYRVLPVRSGKTLPGTTKSEWEEEMKREETPVRITTLPPTPAPSSSTAGRSFTEGGEIARDGRFIAYNNGTVLDTKTNLMWAAKDNGSNINWANAKSYCENYRGGGYSDWRMPTWDELAGLYDAAKSRPGACNTSYSIHISTELIDITCFALWASETRGSDAAVFNFGNGLRYWYHQSNGNLFRALPVRFGK